MIWMLLRIRLGIGQQALDHGSSLHVPHPPPHPPSGCPSSALLPWGSESAAAAPTRVGVVWRWRDVPSGLQSVHTLETV